MPIHDRIDVTLKNGATADLHSALVEWHRLTRLQASHPQLMNALTALARNAGAEIDHAALTALTESGHVNSDRKTLQPLVKDVLLSSLIETSEGQVLANPVLLNSLEDKAVVERMEDKIAAHSETYLRRLRGDDGSQRSR